MIQRARIYGGIIPGVWRRLQEAFACELKVAKRRAHPRVCQIGEAEFTPVIWDSSLAVNMLPLLFTRVEGEILGLTETTKGEE
jgi:hypothetical protein